jgi:hypothetical protein
MENSVKLLCSIKVFVHAAEPALEHDPDDISNLYTAVGKWDVVAEIRRKIRGNGG